MQSSCSSSDADLECIPALNPRRKTCWMLEIGYIWWCCLSRRCTEAASQLPSPFSPGINQNTTLNSNKMEHRLLPVKSPPLLCLELIFSFSEGERWGAGRETVPSSYASSAGASARKDGIEAETRSRCSSSSARAGSLGLGFNAALCGGVYLAVEVLH